MANKIGANGYEPYIGPDDPRLPRGMRARWSRERIQQYVDQANEEFKVVANCGQCDKPLIAREVRPHYLSHVQTVRARQVIGMLEDDTRVTPDVLAEVRAYLEQRDATLAAAN